MDIRATIAQLSVWTELLITGALIVIGAFFHAASRYRAHRKKNGPHPGILEYVWIWATCVFSGVVVHQGVLAWSGSLTAAGVGGALGALLGLEFITNLAPWVLRYLYDREFDGIKDRRQQKNRRHDDEP